VELPKNYKIMPTYLKSLPRLSQGQNGLFQKYRATQRKYANGFLSWNG